MVRALTYKRVYASVDELDGSLHQSLVSRLADACRYDGAAVVFGEGRVILIELRLVTARLLDGSLEIVGHDGSRSSAVKMERILAAAYEVFLALAHHGLNIGELRARKDSHEHLHGDDLSAVTLGQLQTVAGIISTYILSPALCSRCAIGCICATYRRIRRLNVDREYPPG